MVRLDAYPFVGQQLFHLLYLPSYTTHWRLFHPHIPYSRLHAGLSSYDARPKQAAHLYPFVYIDS